MNWKEMIQAEVEQMIDRANANCEVDASGAARGAVSHALMRAARHRPLFAILGCLETKHARCLTALLFNIIARHPELFSDEGGKRLEAVLRASRTDVLAKPHWDRLNEHVAGHAEGRAEGISAISFEERVRRLLDAVFSD